jgi:hypothetical protein
MMKRYFGNRDRLVSLSYGCLGICLYPGGAAAINWLRTVYLGKLSVFCARIGYLCCILLWRLFHTGYSAADDLLFRNSVVGGYLAWLVLWFIRAFGLMARDIGSNDRVVVVAVFILQVFLFLIYFPSNDYSGGATCIHHLTIIVFTLLFSWATGRRRSRVRMDYEK